MQFDAVSLGEGRENYVLDAIEVAERNSQWILVENLHLATQKFFRTLRFTLQRIARTQG